VKIYCIEGVSKMKISKEEFEKEYCKNSNISIKQYHKYFVTLPCGCGEKGCQGWACVCNNKLSIADHKRFHCRENGIKEKIIKYLKLEKTCNSCANFISEPVKYPCGWCNYKDIKTDTSKSCCAYDLHIHRAINILFPSLNAFDKVKVYNDIAEDIEWKSFKNKWNIRD